MGGEVGVFNVKIHKPFGGCDVTAMFLQICEGNTAALALPAARPVFWGKILAGCWHYGPKKRTAVSQLLVVLGKHYSELQAMDFSMTRSQSFDPDMVVGGGVPASRHDYHVAVRQASENKSLINRASKGVAEFILSKAVNEQLPQSTVVGRPISKLPAASQPRPSVRNGPPNPTSASQLKPNVMSM